MASSDTHAEEKNDAKHSQLQIDRRDFDCPLCFQLLYEPVSAECGHTFCRDCLYQAFQIKKHCPICRHHCSLDIMTCPSNVLIAKLLDKYNHVAYQARAKETLKTKRLRKPRHPIFVSRIPECPHVRILLHIFEAKYRVMVNRIMHGDSKFIIAYMQYPQLPHSIGTLCVIKNCTSFPDGRSHIEVIGVKRVKLSNIKLEADSFGLLSAEVDDYVDTDPKHSPLPFSTRPLHSNSNPDNTNTDNNNNSNAENRTNANGADDADIASFFWKLRTSLNVNLNFQKRKWLKTSTDSCEQGEIKDAESERMDSVAWKESDLMDRLLLSVERFIEREESSKEAFYQVVGAPPQGISQFSLWIAGALPRRLLQSGGINSALTQLQLQILVSRNEHERLQLAHKLATLCIQCSQKRWKVQFWIIVCIIGLAILYELLYAT